MESENYGCKEARVDINFFFRPSGGKINEKKKLALLRALGHIELSGEAGGCKATCQSCLEYYMETKKKISGG
ncbi:MAG: hypothetical protein ACD_15C00192G0001 [uncultured bacterium]|nr:MAG: hypothetical protein ACD_15C00192G0001 [uncultured bacterium]